MDDILNQNNDEIKSKNLQGNTTQEEKIVIESSEKNQEEAPQNIVTQGEQFPTYQQSYAQQPQVEKQNSMNEVAYYPNSTPPPVKKKSKVKKFFKGIAVVICVFVISVGSISGYIALTNNNYDIPFLSEMVKEDSSSIPEDSSSIVDESSTGNSDKETPTLLQLAGRENALAVPEIVKKVSPSVVGISCTLADGTSTGTGIIMSEDGYIITNGHVVDGATEITVVISADGKLDETTAKLIGIDTQTDLAVIKVEKEKLTPAEFGISNDLLVGELAIAIGNPLGFELSGSVTGGIISALNRELNIEGKELTLIQTDAAINPGNSGGPLVNSYGQVIGITSAKISSSYAEGLGFAIPIDEAKPIIDDLIEYGYVKDRPMLGISGEEITDVVARYYNIPQGIIIRAIDPESGAAKSSLKIGDIIIGIEGTPITTMNELNKIKETHKAGETVSIKVYRTGQNIDIDVTLSELTK